MQVVVCIQFTLIYTLNVLCVCWKAVNRQYVIQEGWSVLKDLYV